MVCFLNVIAQIAVPEASDVAMNCYHSGNVLWVLQWVLMLAIPLLFLVTEWSGRWSVFAKKYGVNWVGHFLIYLIGFVAFYLLSLPLAFYGEYLREHVYEFFYSVLWEMVCAFWQFVNGYFLVAVSFIWIFYLLSAWGRDHTK